MPIALKRSAIGVFLLNRIVAKNMVMSESKIIVCLATSSLSALNDGYVVYGINSCCVITKEIHDIGIGLLIQAAVNPATSMQYLLEWQQDWARKESDDEYNFD